MAGLAALVAGLVVLGRLRALTACERWLAKYISGGGIGVSTYSSDPRLEREKLVFRL